MDGLHLAVVALLPFQWWPSFPWLHVHAQWSDAAAALLVASWAAQGLWRALDRRLIAAAGAVVAAAALTAWTRPAPGTAMKLLGLSELALLLLVTAERARRPEHRVRVAQAMATSLLVSAAAGLVGLVLFAAGRSTSLVGTYGDLLPGAYARVQAFCIHPNMLASVALVTWSVQGGVTRSRVSRIARALAAPLVLATGSRTLVVVLLGVVLERAPRRPLLRAALVAGAMAVMAALTVVDLRVDPSHPWRATVGPGPTVRMAAATSAARSIADHPLLGAGLTAIPGRAGGQPYDAHCTPVSVLSTRGTLGLATLALLVVACARAHGRPIGGALWLGLALVALDALVEDVEDFRHVWVLLGLAAGASSHRASSHLDTPRVLTYARDTPAHA